MLHFARAYNPNYFQRYSLAVVADQNKDPRLDSKIVGDGFFPAYTHALRINIIEVNPILHQYVHKLLPFIETDKKLAIHCCNLATLTDQHKLEGALKNSVKSNEIGRTEGKKLVLNFDYIFLTKEDLLTEKSKYWKQDNEISKRFPSLQGSDIVEYIKKKFIAQFPKAKVLSLDLTNVVDTKSVLEEITSLKSKRGL